MEKITIIGSGNVATHLSLQLKNCGFEIVQVYSKNIENAKILAEKLNANYTSQMNEINFNSDVYIISVSDSAIEQIVENLNINNKIILHTSGSTSMDVFKNKFDNYGVLYPLQTFSKNRKIEFENIPIFIEANNEKSFEIIEKIANKISTKVYKSDSETRKTLHISAVFANNFTNQMYAIAKNLLDKKNIDFDVLKPLISETTQKIFELSPENAQTGPAVRNDEIIINSHLEMLKNKPKLEKIYKFVSDSIFEFQKNKTNGQF